MNEFVGKTYGQCLALVTNRFAEREALVFKDRRLTYADVEAAVEKASARLATLGLNAGDTLAIWLPNRPEFIWYWLGAARLGWVPVLLNTRLKSDELAYQLRQSECRALILPGQPSFRDFLGDILALCPELAGQEPGALRCREFPRLRHVIACDAVPGGPRGLTGWCAASRTPLPVPPPATDPGGPAMIVYSSGTTSLPKGIVLGHCAWRKAYDAGERAGFTLEDRLYLCVPLFGVLANINGVLPVWARGGTVVLDERFEPERFLRAIQSERCTAAYLLPPMIHKLVQHPGLERYDRSTLRTAVIASTDPESFELVAQRLGIAHFVSSYGMSETTAPVTRTWWHDPLEVRMRTHGKPLPDVEVRICDPDTDAVLAPGREGEIQVRGYCVMLSYHNDPAATRKAITPEGWFKTGDAGVLSADGSLSFLRRLGDGYKHNGFNVAPAEVESVLVQHPHVAAAQVVGLPERESGAVGAAFVIGRDGARVREAEVLAFLRSRLASYKLPRHVFQVDSFPLTGGTGKVQKFKLREMALQELARRAAGARA